jgi:hypothetical protein
MRKRALSGIATIVVVLVPQGFADGFVCKKVAETWRKDNIQQHRKHPPHEDSEKNKATLAFAGIDH